MYSSLALGEVKQPKNSVDTTRKLSEPGMVGHITRSRKFFCLDLEECMTACAFPPLVWWGGRDKRGEMCGKRVEILETVELGEQ